MTTLTPLQFEQADGTGDWRVLNAGADAWFDAGSHSAGAALVLRVAELAEAADHHPDVDLRAAGVHFRLFSHDVGGLSGRDVRLAREISAAARELGLQGDPSAVQRMQVAIDATDTEAVAPFWRAAFSYDRVADDRLVDPLGRQPRLWFQELDQPRPLRNRIHLDAGTPWEFVADKVAALQAAGGRIVHENAWWRTVADAEGNEVDVFPLAEEHGTFPDPGASDWRTMLTASVHYPTSSFTQGAELLSAVAGLADDAGLSLLIDLRYAGVTVDGGKDQHGADGFLDLARAVQSAARALGLAAYPGGVRDFQVGIDALDIAPLLTFWRTALGYVEDPRPDVDDLYDPRRLNPPVFFQQMDEPREQRNRIHVDLFVPADQAQARVAASVAAGGRVVFDAEAPAWWTLADPEGNELDIAVTVGRAERAELLG
jgi:pterin-4a-carbinolamine dehydratase